MARNGRGAAQPAAAPAAAPPAPLPTPAASTPPPPPSPAWDWQQLGRPPSPEELPLLSAPPLPPPPAPPPFPSLSTPLRLALGAASAYLSVYCLRKPWSAATYASDRHKLRLSLAQTCGYAAGKLAAVPLVGGVRRAAAPRALLLAALLSSLAWAAFAAGGGAVAIGAASLPLGAAWPLAYRMVEGRRASDAVGAALGAVVVLGAGVAKALGGALLQRGLSAEQMPLAAAAAALPCCAAAAALLSGTPPPSSAERVEMGERTPLGAAAVRQLCGRHWAGLAMLGVHYAIVSALKDVRDAFQPELWMQLQHAPSSSVAFVATELPATVVVVAFLTMLARVRSNSAAMFIVFGALVLSVASLPALSTLRARGVISGSTWFSALGVATYMAYLPVSTALFDRMAGAMHFGGTATFFMQVMDAVGYAGSVTVLVAMHWFHVTPDQMLYYCDRLVGGAATINL
ncbi:hypothetical protein AB1Y20_014011 [Prymnesium parvum]|uniref:Uncharacterized protein n=1 Tax=Prymnesium parvum TaxID=97485 RepID=A0AB34IFU0_PRYPA